jgi:surface antigen
MTQIPFERLMAYADGELDEEEARAIERRVALDPGLAEQLAALRGQDSLLRSALKAFERTPVPDAARRAVLASAGAPPAVPPMALSLQRWLLPAGAAAAAAILVAVATGWTTASRIEHRLAALEASRIQDERIISEAVSQALETQLSGRSVSWQRPAQDLEGSVKPLRTYQAANGQWCREYEGSVTSNGWVRYQHAIACRVGEGSWLKQVEITTDS